MKRFITGTCAFLLAGGIANAQVEPPAAPPEPQQQPATPAPPAGEQATVSDSDLQTFAEIYVEVEEARDELTLEMNEAGSQEEAQEIQARLQEQMMAAISNHGWSVEKYNEIATAINNDPELRSQAVDRISELSSS